MANQNTKQARKAGFSSKYDQNNNGNTVKKGVCYVGTGRNRKTGKKRFRMAKDQGR